MSDLGSNALDEVDMSKKNEYILDPKYSFMAGDFFNNVIYNDRLMDAFSSLFGDRVADLNAAILRTDWGLVRRYTQYKGLRHARPALAVPGSTQTTLQGCVRPVRSSPPKRRLAEDGSSGAERRKPRLGGAPLRSGSLTNMPVSPTLRQKTHTRNQGV